MPDTPTQTHRTLPLLSEIIAFPLNFMAACLHVISVPFGIEPALAMLVTGSLFGLFLVPIAMVWSVLYLLESSGIWPGAVSVFLTWIGLPFAVCYTVQILVLDKLHLEVKHASLIRPRNRIERASNAFFSSAIDYFPLTCIPWKDDASLSPSQQYVFGVHPHGIHCVPLIMFTTPGGPFDKRFPGLIGSSLTGLAATVMFKLPLIREIFIHMGYVDASRPVANKVLESGRSLFVCTGGEEESMMTSMGKDIVVLKKRKGFVRLALAHGAALVPIFGVGNSDTYKTYDLLGKQRRRFQKQFGIAIPLFHGRYFTPLPYKKPIRVLVGEPIQTPPPTGARPNEALVNEYHEKYITALTLLHAKHVKDRTLEIR